MTWRSKIALLGLANAGKTVFLTSVLDHIRRFEPEKLRLTRERGFLVPSGCEDVTLRRFKRIAPAKTMKEFEYEKFRSALVESAIWPRKTCDVSKYICEFERTDWRQTVALEFLDFPGERFADACMRGKTYDQWSDELLSQYEADQHYAPLVGKYLSTLDECARRPNDNANGIPEVRRMETIVDAYRRTLAALIETYHPLITPSTFLLDRSGSVYDGTNFAQRHSGLSASLQFAPLPEKAREALPATSESFRRNFRAYQKELVEPLFTDLCECNQVVVLVDVPEVLASGVNRFNETSRLVEVLLAACQPGKDKHPYKRFLNLIFRLSLDYVERIAFVATKSDTIRYDEATRLRTLLRKMVDKFIRDYDVEHAYYTCSAVLSTRPHPTDPTQLYGYPSWNQQSPSCLTPPPKRTDSVTPFSPSSLPSDWPSDWAPGDYTFPSVHPMMPKKNTEPPDHQGLDKIMDFFMGKIVSTT